MIEPAIYLKNNITAAPITPRRSILTAILEGLTLLLIAATGWLWLVILS